MIKITKGTEAWRQLERAITAENATHLRLSIRELSTGAKICVKANEGMWTPPLDVEAESRG